MPISGDQWLDPNQRRFSLPQDSCVGDAGPSPTEVTNISKADGAPKGLSNELHINGGSITAGGGRGKSPAQSSNVRGPVPVGYDGP